jgi:hypothetical protein
MLLRQALEQIRAGMPPPVLFNSRIPAMPQKGAVDVHFRTVHNRTSTTSFPGGSAGQVRQGH